MNSTGNGVCRQGSGVPPVNKTMDRKDLQSPMAVKVTHELDELIRLLRSKGLCISSWYGQPTTGWFVARTMKENKGYSYQALPEAVDDVYFPWFLYWEIAWVWLNSGMKAGDRVLDLGGTCSLFSYYLASKGLDVTTVDLNPKLKNNADRVARTMGWRLDNRVMDMRSMDIDGTFDHVTSICVFEHIPLEDRKEINARIKDMLVDDGKLSVTFDYRNPSRTAGINTPADIEKQFVESSGLSVVGNEEFFDSGDDYLVNVFHSRRLGLNIRWKLAGLVHGDFPLREIFDTSDRNEYTFGSLFMRKRRPA